MNEILPRILNRCESLRRLDIRQDLCQKRKAIFQILSQKCPRKYVNEKKTKIWVETEA